MTTTVGPAVVEEGSVETAGVPNRLVTAWHGPLGYCLRVYLAFRAGLFALGFLVAGLLPPNGNVGVPGWPAPPTSGWSTAITGWETADALWYLRIGSRGYRLDDGSGAFFPLYPFLIRVVGTLTGGHWLLAAYLVSNVALIIGLVLLYRLTLREFSESMARKAVLYLCAFPTGFFLFAPYSESLFLALAVGTLYAARTQRWVLAAVLGLFAALSRSPGVLLAVPLAVEAVWQARGAVGPLRRRVTVLAKGAAACLATAGGLVGYLGYWQLQAGDWRRPIDLQKTGWGKENSWPWDTLVAGYKVAVQFPGSNPGAYFLVDFLVVVLVMAAGIWVAVRTRPLYGVFVWASVVFPLFLMWPGRPLLSLPRIYLVIFPTVWALARLAERFRAHEAVLVTSAMSMAVLGAMFVSRNPLF
ncbi:MAG: mannosyltransferase family protein [Mycobacteriales bacterium]